VRVEELHGDLAVERGVAAAVHDGHPTAPDLLEELVTVNAPDQTLTFQDGSCARAAATPTPR
jgi:hypothetical protein